MDRMTEIKARHRWFEGLKPEDKLCMGHNASEADIGFLLDEIGRLEAALEIAEKCAFD